MGLFNKNKLTENQMKLISDQLEKVFNEEQFNEWIELAKKHHSTSIGLELFLIDAPHKEFEVSPNFKVWVERDDSLEEAGSAQIKEEQSLMLIFGVSQMSPEIKLTLKDLKKMPFHHQLEAFFSKNSYVDYFNIYLSNERYDEALYDLFQLNSFNALPRPVGRTKFKYLYLGVELKQE